MPSTNHMTVFRRKNNDNWLKEILFEALLDSITLPCCVENGRFLHKKVTSWTFNCPQMFLLSGTQKVDVV